MARSGTRILMARELRSFFASPTGWMIAAVFSSLASFVFVALLWRYRQATISMAQSGQIRPGVIGLHINDWVVRPYVTSLGTILLFFIPLLTMRALAEERRSGSLELLLSLPLAGRDLILGKYLGALLALLAILLVVPVHALVLAVVSTPDWGAAGIGMLGLLLSALLMLALGVLVSSLSQSQIEAGVLTLGLLLLVGLGPNVAEATSPALARVLGFIAILGRLEDFSRGVLDLRHVFFFLGGTLAFLSLALRGLDLMRWRGL